MRDVLVVLFWIWVLVALGVYSYRLYRRATLGPKSERNAQPSGQDESPGEGSLLDRLGHGSPPPLPDGPIEARLPKSLQDRQPPPATDDVVIPPGGPAEVTRSLHPESHPGEPADAPVAPEPGALGMPRMVTLAEALQGIRMPEDLLPLIEPGEPGRVDGRRARFSGTGTNVPTVAVALGEELRRLGYSVDGLDTVSSAHAGLTATRDQISVTAVIEIDDDTGAVVLELNV